MRSVAYRLFAVSALLLLSACQPRPQQPTAPAALPQQPYAGAKVFTIDTEASFINLRVYRDGPLARFGHNHVIVLSQLQGNVYLQKELPRSGFELRIPVAMATVDRLSDRQAAGADFPGEIPPEAIAGTRNNMLGPRLLTADLYPLIEVSAAAPHGTLPDLVWSVKIKVRDTVSEIELPAHVEIAPDQIVADGVSTLSQVQLGLTPFSVLGGGLRVRDSIDVSYHLVARAVPEAADKQP